VLGVVILTEGAAGKESWVGSLGGLAVVTPPGEIDLANAGQLREELAAAATQHATIVVDMTANKFCDSSGISALIAAHKRAQAAGGELRLVMASPAVRKVFKVTGVDRVLRIFDSLPEAVAARPLAPGAAP
jgi:anti-sigma B factor antagonist